jgi:hypothetical protein
MAQKCKKKYLKPIDAEFNHVLNPIVRAGKKLGKHCKARKKDKKVLKRG